MATFSERLQQLQQEQHLLKKDIADKVGISVMAYYRYETGERIPNATILIALADFFKVSLDYLVGRSDDPTIH